jgi:uncharacterized membrane protein
MGSSAVLPHPGDAERLRPIPRSVTPFPFSHHTCNFLTLAAYQSALLTTPLLAFLLLTNLLIPLPSFLRTFLILASVGATLYTAFRAWKDAQEGLGRFWLPYIGEIAERWVNEE